MAKATLKIIVQKQEINLFTQNSGEFISLTDIARYRNSAEPFSIINNWMRSRSTIEFIGLWEKLNNPDFKHLEFEVFKIRIIQFFPQTNKFNGTSASHPVVYD